mgnify:CR=1 FL=1
MGRGGFRIGAGRKPTGVNVVNITLTLTKAEAQVLKERAASMNMTVSRFIAKWLNLTPPKATSDLPDSLTGGIRLSDAII